jgi:hypothetical protein
VILPSPKNTGGKTAGATCVASVKWAEWVE